MANDAWQLEENTDRWLLEEGDGVWLLEEATAPIKLNNYLSVRVKDGFSTTERIR